MQKKRQCFLPQTASILDSRVYSYVFLCSAPFSCQGFLA